MGLLSGLSTFEVMPQVSMGHGMGMTDCGGCPDMPCKDMSPLCLANVGCVALLVGLPAQTAALFDYTIASPDWANSPTMSGRDIKPGLEPPILVG
ncbi:MAG: hypothetical protein K2P94_08350 [Rhodospirillaceae bacterium]|nr:hypothetical protein [Rhodospirillaceae bacterium]